MRQPFLLKSKKPTGLDEGIGMIKTGKKSLQNQKTAYLFILPAMIVLTIFVFVPLIAAFVISFLNMDIYMKDISFAGIANYITMFRDDRVWNATGNTFWFAILEIPLQIFLALLLTMLMIKNTRIHKVLRATFYIPYICSMTAISILWSMILNPNSGMLAYTLRKIGITMPNLLNSTTWAIVVVALVTVWKNFGYTLTLLSAAALDIPAALYEAAEIDGANSFSKFIYVTVPSIRNTISFCIVTTLIATFQAFDQIYVMTGGGPQNSTETLVGYIYSRGFQTTHDLGYASTISVYLFVIIAVITFILRRHTLRGEEES